MAYNNNNQQQEDTAAAVEEKQNFLIEQIMNPGYDIHEFGNFMTDQKAGGNDINNFTMSELQRMVNIFKNMPEQLQKYGRPSTRQPQAQAQASAQPQPQPQSQANSNQWQAQAQASQPEPAQKQSLLQQMPKPSALRPENLADDEEEEKLYSLVAGDVGTTGDKITPRIVQDQRNWADKVMEDVMNNEETKEAAANAMPGGDQKLNRRDTNFFSSSDVKLAEKLASPGRQQTQQRPTMTRMIDTKDGKGANAGKAAASSGQQVMDAMKKPQTNSKHQGTVRILFEPNVVTKQLTPTRLSTIETSTVEVIVSDGLMQQKSGFLSKSSWLSFKIRIPHIRSEVRRKDEDFDLLQDYLIKAYPNVIVPTTKAFNRLKFNEQKYMTKRALLLSRFSANVLRSRILRGDQFLMSFLTETDDKKYGAEKTTMLRQQKVVTIEQLVTPEGRIILPTDTVDKIRTEVNERCKRVSTQTEKSYIYLHQQIKQLSQDLAVAAQTAENIRDTFGALHKTSYDLQSREGGDANSEDSDQQIRFFYQTTREVFTKWAAQLTQESTHLKDSQVKFFQHSASQGERIGAISNELKTLEKQHQQMQATFAEKQKSLFNKKDPSKWENQEVSRMTKVDQDELLRDPNSAALIAPQDQASMFKVRQTHAALIQALLSELQTNQAWACYDMRLNFTDLIQFMKQNAVESSQIWSEYEQKLNPYQTQ